MALAMDKIPREVCLGLGNDVLKSEVGVDKLMEALQKDIAPDAHDSAFRDVVVFFGLRRTHQSLDEYLAHFQRALRRVEARPPNGAMFPEIIVSSLYLHHAGLSPNQKSLELASPGGDASFETTKKHMKRIPQACGVDLKLDSLNADCDLDVMRPASVSPADSHVKEDVSEAQVVSKKKRENTKQKGKDPIQSVRHSGEGNPNRVNPRTGYRNRCFGCGSEFHLLPNCPGNVPQDARRVSISMDPPERHAGGPSAGNVYQTSINMGLALTSVAHDSVVIIDTGASANLVGADWLEKRNLILQSIGRPQAGVREASASFRYGDGRTGDVHKAAITPISIAGCTGQVMAYVVGAEIPALLGKEALETLRAHP